MKKKPKQKPVTSDLKCSEHFEKAFSSGGGGIVRECVCGRLYFNRDDAGCFDEGELEGYEQKAKNAPDLYIPTDYTVCTYVVHGNEFVMGCPCEGGARYEKFIVEHARSIAEYLNVRADRIAKMAEDVKAHETVKSS